VTLVDWRSNSAAKELSFPTANGVEIHILIFGYSHF
jgi:hypothetical protein